MVGVEEAPVYYAKGKSASRMVSKKRLDYSGTINTYGPLKRDVDFRPIVLEVSAGLGDKAHDLFKGICTEARRLGLRAPSSHLTWPAPSFAAYWGQRLSHSASKLTAMAVHLGVKAVAKEANDRVC